jgi:hypothetical protein
MYISIACYTFTNIVRLIPFIWIIILAYEDMFVKPLVIISACDVVVT